MNLWENKGPERAGGGDGCLMVCGFARSTFDAAFDIPSPSATSGLSLRESLTALPLKTGNDRNT